MRAVGLACTARAGAAYRRGADSLLLFHVRGRLLLGRRELAFLCRQDADGVKLLATNFVTLAADQIQQLMRQAASEGRDRGLLTGGLLFTLSVSHTRAEPLSEADIKPLCTLVRLLPTAVVARLHGEPEVHFETVCWLRLSSTSEALLPLPWDVDTEHIFLDRNRLDSSDLRSI